MAKMKYRRSRAITFCTACGEPDARGERRAAGEKITVYASVPRPGAAGRPGRRRAGAAATAREPPAPLTSIPLTALLYGLLAFTAGDRGRTARVRDGPRRGLPTHLTECAYIVHRQLSFT